MDKEYNIRCFEVFPVDKPMLYKLMAIFLLNFTISGTLSCYMLLTHHLHLLCPKREFTYHVPTLIIGG